MAVKKPIFASVLVAFLVGCASQPNTSVTSPTAELKVDVRCKARVAPEERVELEMVDTLVARNQHFAALARLQQKSQQNLEYWGRYGQLLAKTERLDQSESVFQQLFDKCGSSEANHGLGLVSIKKGKLGTAIRYLEAAVNQNPSSSQIRNDYGYALLLRGHYDLAKGHLRTALELNNGNGTARQNLAVAYLLSNDDQGLAMMQNVYHFSDDEKNYAQAIARQIRSAQ